MRHLPRRARHYFRAPSLRARFPSSSAQRSHVLGQKEGIEYEILCYFTQGAVEMDARTLFKIATLVRVLLLAVGHIQDATLEVPYTDVDYLVFTDASRYVGEDFGRNSFCTVRTGTNVSPTCFLYRFITRGDSPYERDTYRYSPLVAWTLIPNVLVHPMIGKCIFAAGDLLAGWLIREVLLPHGYSEDACLFSMSVWLFNPYTMTISTRGSCESLVSIMMLTVLYCLSRGSVCVAAATYGLATHLRIYPVIYALPLIIFLGNMYHDELALGQCSKLRLRRTAVASLKEKSRDLELLQGNSVAKLVLQNLGHLATRERLKFACVSAGIFLMCGFICYLMYGVEFLHEAFLYHLSRTDIRHNFSPAFYHAYLDMHDSVGHRLASTVLGKLLTALPQISVVVVIGARFARDLPLCLLMQTICFVTFNRVCTAQYFVWYFCLLPLAVPLCFRAADERQNHEKTSVFSLLGSVVKRFIGLRVLSNVVVWQIAQILWLWCAYLLEYGGYGFFLHSWAASIVFLVVNARLVVKTIRSSGYVDRNVKGGVI